MIEWPCEYLLSMLPKAVSVLNYDCRNKWAGLTSGPLPFSPATARRSPHSPHAAAFLPLCSPLLHRYLLYPQPNVIGLRSILRNCFPPSRSLSFRHVHVSTVSRALSSSRTSLCHPYSAANRKCNVSWRRVLFWFWTVEKWWYTVHKKNMGIFLNLTFHKSLH